MAAVLATAFVLAPAGPLAAAERLRAPGFTWGEIRYPSSEQALERDDLVLEGAVDQGLDVVALSSVTRVNLFGRVRYKVDSEELDFNNKLVGGVGARLLFQVSDSAVVGLGALYEADRRFRTDRTLDGTTVFTDWFGSWRFGGEGRRRYPGLTWGELRYPASHDPTEDEDLLIEGAVEQGVDWLRVGAGGAFNTFAKLEYQADSEGLEYYRSVSGALGLKLKIPFARTGLLQIGGQYLSDYRWESELTQDVFMVFVNWSASWDARTVRRDLPQP